MMVKFLTNLSWQNHKPEDFEETLTVVLGDFFHSSSLIKKQKIWTKNHFFYLRNFYITLQQKTTKMRIFQKLFPIVLEKDTSAKYLKNGSRVKVVILNEWTSDQKLRTFGAHCTEAQ